MKILLFANLAKNKAGNIFGGAEKTIINLANWVAENTDNEVTLFSVEGKEKPYKVSNKVIYEGIEFYHRNKLQIHFEIMKNTRYAIKKYNPDFVISFWIQPLFYLILNGYGKRIKYVYSERNDPNLEYGKIAKFMRKVVLKDANGVVFQTRDAQTYFSRETQKKSLIIHNPVYVEYDKYPIRGFLDNRIVAVGRLNAQKNYVLLLEAMAEIADEYPEISLEIYGEGDQRETLQQKIDCLNMTDRISLMGSYSNVLDKIYGARAFVMTSLYEGMPNALMEAMCLGIPVICSNCPCGGPKELIENGINGYLFENNDINDLTKKLRILLNSENSEIARNEKKICFTHNQATIFGKWLEYIYSL